MNSLRVFAKPSCFTLEVAVSRNCFQCFVCFRLHYMPTPKIFLHEIWEEHRMVRLVGRWNGIPLPYLGAFGTQVVNMTFPSLEVGMMAGYPYRQSVCTLLHITFGHHRKCRPCTLNLNDFLTGFIIPILPGFKLITSLLLD
jgi:hypothetical protein